MRDRLAQYGTLSQIADHPPDPALVLAQDLAWPLDDLRVRQIPQRQNRPVGRVEPQPGQLAQIHPLEADADIARALVFGQLADNLATQPPLQSLDDGPHRQAGSHHRVLAQTKIQFGRPALKTRRDIVDALHPLQSRRQFVAQCTQHVEVVAGDLHLHRRRLLAHHPLERGLVQLVFDLQFGDLGQLPVDRLDQLRHAAPLTTGQRHRQRGAVGAGRVADIGQSRRVHSRARIDRRHLVAADLAHDLAHPPGHAVGHFQPRALFERQINVKQPLVLTRNKLGLYPPADIDRRRHRRGHGDKYQPLALQRPVEEAAKPQPARFGRHAFAPAQKTRRQHRHRHHGHPQRRHQRKSHRPRLILEQLAGQPLQVDDRQKDRHRGQGSRHNRYADLARSFGRGRRRVLAPLQMPVDVLDYHNRIIDQHPRPKRQPAQRHDVER